MTPDPRPDGHRPARGLPDARPRRAAPPAGAAVWGLHDPVRPSWRCGHCAKPWPCLTAQRHLVGAYLGRLVGLGALLATLRDMAVTDLPDTDPHEIGNQFVGWYRHLLPTRPALPGPTPTPVTRRPVIATTDHRTQTIVHRAVQLRDAGQLKQAAALLTPLIDDLDPRRGDDTTVAALTAWVSVAGWDHPHLTRHLAYLHQHLDDRYGSGHTDTIRTAMHLVWLLEDRGDHAAAAAWYGVTADGNAAAGNHSLAVTDRLQSARSAHRAGRCATAHVAATRALHTVIANGQLWDLGPATVWTSAAILLACNQPHAGEAVLIIHEPLLPAPGTLERQQFAELAGSELLRMTGQQRHDRVCTGGEPRVPGLFRPGRDGTPDAREAFLDRWTALLAGAPLPPSAHGDGWHTPVVRHDIYRRHQLQHESIRAIAGCLGCSADVVTRILRQAQLPTGRPA